MIKGWLKFVLALVSSLIISAAYGLAFVGPNPETSQLQFTGFSNGSVGATITGPLDVQAGQFQGFFDGDLNGIQADDFFRFFCIDISHYANGGPNPYTRSLGLPATLSSLQQQEVTRLFDDFYPNPTTGTYYNGGVTNFGQFTDANASAAFQLALWEIFFGNGTVLSSPALATAQGYLAQIAGEAGNPVPLGWTFYTFTSACQSDQCYQTYLSVEYSQPLRFTPEPGSLILLCVAVLAAWATAMHRRQTA